MLKHLFQNATDMILIDIIILFICDQDPETSLVGTKKLKEDN